jgi:predicted dinucleotide-binding enzyme
MRIGILGTGTMATALGQAWARVGHDLAIAGRSPARATTVATQIGDRARAVPASELADASDVVVIAVAWEGVDEALALANTREGALAGKTLIDCTNAVDYTTGVLKPATGSAAQHIAAIATGAHVVKALHLFAGQSWLSRPDGLAPRTVAICGDDQGALDLTAGLVRDLGASSAVIGGLDHARQLEDVAGFVMRVVASGYNPTTAVPSVEPVVEADRA